MKNRPFGFLFDSLQTGEYSHLREQLKAELENAFGIASKAAPPGPKGPDQLAAPTLKNDPQ
jgi:hypothetical protein